MALAAVSALVLGACAEPNPTSILVTLPPVSASPALPSGSVGQGTVVRWFVGLGGGTTAAQVAAEKAFVASYNQINKDGVVISLEIQPSTYAYDALKSEMAAGNAPDIVGPAGLADRAGFGGLFMDLSPEVSKFNYDLKAFPDALIKIFKQGGDGLVGLPYLLDPGYIWYNKDAFAAANLPDLPTKVGDQYQGQPWDWTALGNIAAQLTLDKTGKKSTDKGFDKTNIVKYGFDFDGLDARQIGSVFGAGSFVDSDNKTAVIPTAWADAYSWYYNAIWTGHYAPTATAVSGTLLNGDSVASGNVAMSVAWSSNISSLWNATTKVAAMKSWNIAVMPSWKGGTTSPLEAKSFSITKASKNADAAFRVMLAIMADTTLMKVYGGLPAKSADRTLFTSAVNATLTPVFPGLDVNWSVLDEMVAHPAIPSADADLPARAQAATDYAAFLTRLQGTNPLDVTAELAKLKATLQADFDAARPLAS